MSDANDQRPPEPPSTFARSALPWYAVPAGTRLARIHSAARAPLWFGPAAGRAALGRFDDPERAGAGASFGVCYLGLSREAAFAETFLRRLGLRVLAPVTFTERAISVIATTRALRVAAMFGPGLAALGATAAVTHGPHEGARRWARALWVHPERPDGLAYRCRHDDDALAVALFERAADALVVRETQPAAADRAWFGAMLDRYRIAVAD